MKNRLFGFLATGVIAASLIVSCSSNNPSTPSASTSTSTPTSTSVKKKIALSKTVAELIYGESVVITAIYTPAEGKEVIWESSDESVATVTQGTVTSCGIGETTITATFDGESATCKVTVSYGNYNPVLNITNISGDSLGLAIGDSFTPATSVYFNGKYFDCGSTLTPLNTSVVEIDSSNNIKAVGNGTTVVKVVGNWNGFEGALMQKEIIVTVSNDLVFYTETNINGRKTVANNVSLGLVSSFEGKTYDTTATVTAVVKDSGVVKTATLDYEKNGVIEMDANGVVTAKSVGSAIITATYAVDASTNYVCTLKVTVTCPVETYTKGTVRFCTTENFPVESIFGSGARIVKASQGKSELTVKNLGKRIDGIVANGGDTEPIIVQTTKGGYTFNKLFCYTKALTNDNAASLLTLADGKVVSGYYILGEDLDVDMSSQNYSAYSAGASTNRYFGGTLDGELHTFKAKVGSNGIFGGFGDNVIIKNTHFDFDFVTPDLSGTTKVYSVGLAKNTATWPINGFSVDIDNCYFTASNYKQGCYTMSDYKIVNTRMNNVYVNLTGSGTESMPTFTDRAQEIACLYHADTILMSGAYDAFKGGLYNVQIVTGTSSFIPVGCGYWNADYYVTYAKTDTSGGSSAAIGAHNRHQSQPNEGYCIALWDSVTNNKLHFGNIPRNLNGGEFCAYSYDASGDKKEWGICRFNTTANLKTYLGSGVTKIGSWPIDA